ncbi:MAG: hypothetical protein M1834_004437 [Cirrosporium novae-zelandiae]|nr:MAG: hypothetical protein M1834_004437 [Cirrosporium novae-zelandiae]
MEIINTPPVESSFILLSAYQSHTPDSFFSGPPVLHYSTKGAKLLVNSNDLARTPSLRALSTDSFANGEAGQNGHVDGGEEGEGEGREVEIEGVDIWVSSENFTIFSTQANRGLNIPYPHITVHAVQRLPTPSSEVRGLYMQILPNPPSSTFDDFSSDTTISLTIIPSSTSQRPASQFSASQLFNALSNCSNLHPSPHSADDQEMADSDAAPFEILQGSSESQTQAGLPPPMPGSGGWITAENVHEYFDEEGNPRVPLGKGAGRVRGRDEAEVEGGRIAVNGGGGGEEGEEAKWRRTE